MKLNYYFLIPALVLNTMHADAQIHVAPNAIRVAALVPATGSTGCMIDTKPCAVTNKGTDRTITVKVEESFLANNSIHKKVIQLDRVAPNENRYIGCAGCTKDGPDEKCLGYKIILAYYDEPDSVRVRALFNDKENKVASN